MRHKRHAKQFSRPSGHRRALFKNLASSLIEHELIKTTLPKAKALRGFVEPLITMAKEDSVAKRRIAFARLGQRKSVTKLFNELGKRFGSRPGGYTRVIKCGNRDGDNAPMAYVELVDRPEVTES